MFPAQAASGKGRGMMAEHGGHLGAVYAARSPEEVAAGYDAWAETYEDEMRRAGYRHPSIAVALAARHIAPGTAPLLDAGAGTGLLGEWLALLGYARIEALDLSEGMLAVAARKGVYAALHRLALGGPLPFADGEFGGVVSAGVFTTGHVGAAALPELLRITRGGGAIVLTVKLPLWEGEVGQAIAAAGAAGRLQLIDRTPPYVSMPGDPATVPSLAVVLRVAG